MESSGKDKYSMKQLYKKYGELILYLIVGVLTTVVSLGGGCHVCLLCQQ